jgi:hypothetical protein
MFGLLMIGSMAVGALSNTVNDSFANVEETCKALNDAKEKLKKMTDQWQSTIGTEMDADLKLKNFHQDLIAQGQMTVATSAGLKESFRLKRNTEMISFAITIFLITLTLLFKYFNIFPRIWNYFAK